MKSLLHGSEVSGGGEIFNLTVSKPFNPLKSLELGTKLVTKLLPNPFVSIKELK